MKANELMIGDWVRIDEPDKYAGATGQIQSLMYHREDDAAYFNVFIQGKFGYVSRDVCSDDIRPIPLTADILEKNGFNKIIPKKKFTKYLGYTSKFLKRCLVIELAQNRYYKVSIKHEGMSDKITIRHIQYVHELQHILFAFGMDADLKIPDKSKDKTEEQSKENNKTTRL